MTRVAAFAFALLLSLPATAAPCPPPVAEFASRQEFGRFRTSNYCNRLVLTNTTVAGEAAFAVMNPAASKETGDTAWTLVTPRFKVVPGREYALHLRARGEYKLSGAKPVSHIAWFGKDGNALSTMDALNRKVPLTSVIAVDTGGESFRNTLKKGRVPAAAASAHVFLGGDYPNMAPGQGFALSRVAYYERDGSHGWDFGDMSPPELEMLTASPSPDQSAEIVFRLKDDSAIDMRRFRCRIAGRDVTAGLDRRGERFCFRPASPWPKDSLLTLEVDCADEHGNVATRYGFASFCTARRVHPRASLRDDGMVLRDGMPFFPIGVYGVRKCLHNGGDLDRAVRELKEGGVNLVGTYLMRNGPTAAEYRELIGACNRNGVHFWAQPAGTHSKEGPQGIFRSLSEGLRQPCAFMWEIGDDTAFNRSADELRMDNDACHAVDPDALTSQADISPDEDRVTPYARHADVFKSENYPIRKETVQPGELAEMSRDLMQAASDLKRGGANPPCLFSIVQSFVGWGWKRYPTNAELRAMSYLAIALRVRGLTYYTYHSDNGKGVSSTPERFRDFVALTREISALEPHLTSRDAAVQPCFEVLAGAGSAAYGQPPVAMLLKESGFFVAVNVTDAPLKVRFSMPDGSSFVHEFNRCGVCLRGEKGRKNKAKFGKISGSIEKNEI